MGRGMRQKGNRWEREAAKLLSIFGGFWKRIPGSGALSHTFNDASLSSDVVGKYPWWRKKFRGECKYGYGGSKSMSVKREWITKNRVEAEEADGYPCLLLKYKDVRTDIESARLICFNFDTWNLLMEEIEELYEEYIELLERISNG